MQCAKQLKKRSLETEVEPWSCQAKRVCLGAELQPSECPMETSQSFPFTSSQQREQQTACRQAGVVQLCCQRCLRGEPGHISHILGH